MHAHYHSRVEEVAEGEEKESTNRMLHSLHKKSPAASSSLHLLLLKSSPSPSPSSYSALLMMRWGFRFDISHTLLISDKTLEHDL